MTKQKSVRHILEVLNKNKQDLLVLQDQISKQMKDNSDSILSLGIDFPEDSENLEQFVASCNILIDFWGDIHNLTGGLRFQEVIQTLVGSDKKLRVDLNKIGISLLRSNQAKPHSGTPPISSIQEESWLELVSLLRLDSKFIEAAKSVRSLQKKRDEIQTSQELQAIFSNYSSITPEDKDEFSKEYHKTRLSIEEFLKTKYPEQHIAPSVKTKKTEKKDPKSDFDNYSTYVEADERELARMKRTGNYSVRKRGKKRKRPKSS